MHRRLIAAFALFAPVAAAPAAAAEVIIANVMPVATDWMIEGTSTVTIPPGSHTIKKLDPGVRNVRVIDHGGGNAVKSVTFSADQLATWDGRQFWCLASRASGGTAAEILVLPPDVCEQFLANQPPPSRGP